MGERRSRNIRRGHRLRGESPGQAHAECGIKHSYPAPIIKRQNTAPVEVEERRTIGVKQALS